MTDEQEQHYHDHSGPDRTCVQCREGLKYDLARALAHAMSDISIDGPGEAVTVRLVVAIDSIFDEWPR